MFKVTVISLLLEAERDSWITSLCVSAPSEKVTRSTVNPTMAEK
jgi:hypothetical protein